MRFSNQQIRDFTHRTLRSIGPDGWALLVPRLRHAVIAEAALHVLRAQSRDVPVAAMDELLSRMLKCAGVDE